ESAGYRQNDRYSNDRPKRRCASLQILTDLSLKSNHPFNGIKSSLSIKSLCPCLLETAMTDCWPRLEIARFRNETDADYKARAARIREIVLTFRHRYYT